MARESAKRSASTHKDKKRSAAASKSRKATVDVPPQSDRAPGRGKYDRSRTPDERQKEQMRRLLDAAGHVFAEMGWADATVEAIVSRAGMSRRTFYEHFDDLKDCLITLQQKVSKRTFRAVEMQVQAQNDPAHMLEFGIQAFLGGISMFPHLARVMFRVTRAAGPEFEAAQEQMMSRFHKLVFDGVQMAYELGRAKRPPDDTRIFLLVSGMEALAMRYVMRGEEAKAMEAAPILIDMVQKTFS